MNDFMCHDCGKAVNVKGKELENGFFLRYPHGEEMIDVVKCKDCYEKNPALENFQKCEVYSRIVGYLRPVSQWNPGKKTEYADRKVFKL